MVVQECKCLPSILKARKGKSHDATQRKGLIQKIDASRTGKARPSASIVSNSAKTVGSIPELSQIFRLLSWAGARNCTTFAIHKPHPESGRSSAESSFCWYLSLVGNIWNSEDCCRAVRWFRDVSWCIAISGYVKMCGNRSMKLLWCYLSVFVCFPTTALSASYLGHYMTLWHPFQGTQPEWSALIRSYCPVYDPKWLPNTGVVCVCVCLFLAQVRTRNES